MAQSFVGALALGAAASAAPMDAFGNPLCITSDDHGAPAPDGDDGAERPECCLAGCACAAFGPASDVAAWDAPPFVSPMPQRRGFAAGPPPVHIPGSIGPRAPPLTS